MEGLTTALPVIIYLLLIILLVIGIILGIKLIITIDKTNAILDDDARRLRINNRALFNKAQELQNEVVEYQILLCKRWKT